MVTWLRHGHQPGGSRFPAVCASSQTDLLAGHGLFLQASPCPISVREIARPCRFPSLNRAALELWHEGCIWGWSVSQDTPARVEPG